MRFWGHWLKTPDSGLRSLGSSEWQPLAAGGDAAADRQIRSRLVGSVIRFRSAVGNGRRAPSLLARPPLGQLSACLLHCEQENECDHRQRDCSISSYCDPIVSFRHTGTSELGVPKTLTYIKL